MRRRFGIWLGSFVWAFTASALASPSYGAPGALEVAQQRAMTVALQVPPLGFDVDESGFARPVEKLGFRRRLVDGRTVRYVVPEAPRGLVYFFHGHGGSSARVNSVEARAVLQSMYAEGFAIVAPDAQDQSTRLLDGERPPQDNADLARSLKIREDLISAGIVSEETPVFAVGYSAGGRFAGYFGHAAAAAGVPVRAIAYHQARGRTTEFGHPPPVPSIWLPALHDNTVDPDRVSMEYAGHVARGGEGLLLWHRPGDLDARRFTRDPDIGHEQSAAIASNAAVARLFDADGKAAVRAPGAGRRIRHATARLPEEVRSSARTQLHAVLATHAFNGEHAAREAAFFVSAL